MRTRRSAGRRTGRFVASACGVAALLLAAGCAPAGGDDDTITLWYTKGVLSAAALKDLPEAFPGVDIDAVPVSDVDQKLKAGIRAGSGLPDIAWVGGNLPDYFSVADEFVDMSQHGFDDVADEYLDWKVKIGQTPSGAQIGLPVDVGPYGFFYRPSELKAAGLPTDPDEVGDLVSTWDGYEKVARTMADAGHYACDSANSNYLLMLAQNGYAWGTFDDGEPTGDLQNPVNRESWERAIKQGTSGLCANVDPYSTDWNSAVQQDRLAGFLAPGYMTAALKDAAGDSAGDWALAGSPGGPASFTGSYLSVLASSDHVETASEIALYLTRPAAQTSAWLDEGVMPASVTTIEDPAADVPDDFFGGQDPLSVFGAEAQEAPFIYRAPYYDAILQIYGDAFTNVVKSGADPDRSFDRATAQAETQFQNTFGGSDD